jgi:histidine ammonia-lyase
VTVSVGSSLSFGQVARVAAGEDVGIGPGVRERMAATRAVVERAVASRRPVYGISTGIGDLARVRIDPAEGVRLQHDLVRSHATAVGARLDRATVRAMLLLKARTLAFGSPGARFEVLERLVAMLNAAVHPVVPAQGSLGASGDLALLAHLALPLIGEGEAEYKGEVMTAGKALAAAGLEPIELSHKEGLTLVNGTEAMLALGVLTWLRAQTLAHTADVTGAMTLEACLGTDRAFDPAVIALRAHDAAAEVAGNVRRLLAGSEIVASHRDSEHLVQDAYSLRCIPQVHGAYRGGMDYVRRVLEDELASAVDNPMVIESSGDVISSGNFHGEALGLALDHLTLCAAGFATIAERRVARLVDAELSNGLPAFLTTDAGRRSGFMLAQYTAASLVSENRSLCFPASADTIPASAGQEDHASMGMTSARKAAAVVSNAEAVIAIEALCAAQGLDLRAPVKPSPGTAAALAAIRSVSPMVDEDRSLGPDIEAVRSLVADGALIDAAAEGAGPLA